MKVNLCHNVEIKTFDDIAQHLLLEAKVMDVKYVLQMEIVPQQPQLVVIVHLVDLVLLTVESIILHGTIARQLKTHVKVDIIHVIVVHVIMVITLVKGVGIYNEKEKFINAIYWNINNYFGYIISYI